MLSLLLELGRNATKIALESSRTVPKLGTVFKVNAAITIGVEWLAHSYAKNIASDVQVDNDSHNETMDASQIILPSEEKIALAKIPKQKFELYGRVAIKAAKDIGYKAPALVTFSDAQIEVLTEKKSPIFQTLPSGMGASSLSFFNHSFHRNAAIDITYDMVKKSSLEEMYTVAGHEALHAKENHSLSYVSYYPTYAFSKYILKEYAPKLFGRFPLLSSLLLATNVYHLLGQVLEYRADTMSAKELCSAEHIANSLAKIDKDMSEQVENYVQGMKSIDWVYFSFLLLPQLVILPNHPSTESRISTLQVIQSDLNYKHNLGFFAFRKDSTSKDECDSEIKITQEKNSSSNTNLRSL